MNDLDMDDLAQGVQILVEGAVKRAAPTIARQASAEVEVAAAVLRASFEATNSQVLAVIAEGGRHEPWA